MAYEIQEKAKLNQSTPEGIYNIKLALTDDPEAARQAGIEAARQILEAQVAHSPLPDTIQ